MVFYLGSHRRSNLRGSPTLCDDAKRTFINGDNFFDEIGQSPRSSKSLLYLRCKEKENVPLTPPW